MTKNTLLQLQLQSLIKDLEIKLSKTKKLKSKLEVLHQLNELKSQLTELYKLESELKTQYTEYIENKYQSVISDKITDINRQIEKATQRGKFMTDYTYDLEKEAFIKDSNYLQFINKFWMEIIGDLNPDDRIMARFLIQMSDTSARTLNKT